MADESTSKAPESAAPEEPETTPGAPESDATQEDAAEGPTRYTLAETTVGKAGEAEVIVGEFAGSITGVEVQTKDGWTEADTFEAEAIAAGTARVKARSKTLTTGKTVLRLAVLADD